MAPRFKATAKVTSKGQITLPLALRKELGIRVGDRVRFERDRGEMRIRVEHDGDDPFAKYQGIGNPGIKPGVEGVLEWIREIRGDRD